MLNARRLVATAGAGALLAAPLALVGAPAANAADKEFRCAGAEVDFSVEKDDGRFEVDVDVDDARPGTKYRLVLRHDGKVFHNKVHRASGDGDVADLDKKRPNTAGKDVFKLKVKKIGGGSCTSTITRK